MLKKYNSRKNTVRLAAALFLLSALAGCAGNPPVKEFSLLDKPGRYKADPKINLSVGLALGGLYEDSRPDKGGEENKIPNETYRKLFGDKMVKYSAEFASVLFDQVSAAKTPGQEDQARPELFLSPSVVAILHSPAAIRDDVMKSMLVVEWKLEDKDRNVIWIDTVKGSNKVALTGGIDWEDYNNGMFDDLFYKSFQAIKASPEIRKYEQERRKDKSRAPVVPCLSADKCSRDVITYFTNKRNEEEKALAQQ